MHHPLCHSQVQLVNFTTYFLSFFPCIAFYQLRSTKVCHNFSMPPYFDRTRRTMKKITFNVYDRLWVIWCNFRNKNNRQHSVAAAWTSPSPQSICKYIYCLVPIVRQYNMLYCPYCTIVRYFVFSLLYDSTICCIFSPVPLYF